MKAWVFGDNVDTDVIAPGRYMKFGIEDIARHCLEALDPDFQNQLMAKLQELTGVSLHRARAAISQ